MSKVETDKKEVTKWYKLSWVIPSLVPLFYIQGTASHAGKLEPYGNIGKYFPLTFEQAMMEAFFFYSRIVGSWIVVGVMLFAIIFGVFCLADRFVKKKKIEDNELEVYLKRIWHKYSELRFFAVIPVAGCIAFLLMVLSVLPYLVSKNITKRTNRQSTFEKELTDSLLLKEMFL